jgi:hypothetical protein
VTVTTQNVRVGMSPAHSRHDILQAAQHSSVLVTQEMGKRVARRYAPPGWGTAHFAGLRRGDCATYWNRDMWRLHHAWTRIITWASFRAGHRFVLATTLRGVGPYQGKRLAVVCVHSITRSETAARRPVFNRGMDRLGDLLSALRSRYRYVVVGGDWNRIWSKRRQFAGMGSVSPSRSTGPKGGRVDYFEWTTPAMRYAGERIIGNTYSDHNGTRVHLKLR